MNSFPFPFFMYKLMTVIWAQTTNCRSVRIHHHHKVTLYDLFSHNDVNAASVLICTLKCDFLQGNQSLLLTKRAVSPLSPCSKQLSSKCQNTTQRWNQIVFPLKHSSALPLSEMPHQTVSLSVCTVECLFVCCAPDSLESTLVEILQMIIILQKLHGFLLLPIIHVRNVKIEICLMTECLLHSSFSGINSQH